MSSKLREGEVKQWYVVCILKTVTLNFRRMSHSFALQQRCQGEKSERANLSD